MMQIKQANKFETCWNFNNQVEAAGKAESGTISLHLIKKLQS